MRSSSDIDLSIITTGDVVMPASITTGEVVTPASVATANDANTARQDNREPAGERNEREGRPIHDANVAIGIMRDAYNRKAVTNNSQLYYARRVLMYFSPEEREDFRSLLSLEIDSTPEESPWKYHLCDLRFKIRPYYSAEIGKFTSQDMQLFEGLFEKYDRADLSTRLNYYFYGECCPQAGLNAGVAAGVAVCLILPIKGYVSHGLCWALSTPFAFGATGVAGMGLGVGTGIAMDSCCSSLFRPARRGADANTTTSNNSLSASAAPDLHIML
jgi:hypothetical protein